MKKQELISSTTMMRKTAVSLAVAGFLLSGQALAETHNLNSNASYTQTVDTTALDVIFNNNDSSSDVFTGNMNLTLGAGVNLTGYNGIGTVLMGVFTRNTVDNTSWGDDVNFSGANTLTSTLTLLGNNAISGVVGWHFDINDSTGYADALDAINISNTGNIFNNAVYANGVNLNSGSTVQFLGDVIGNLNYAGSNSIVTLGNGVTLSGDVTNTSISNSSLIFNGSGTINGRIGIGSSSIAIGTVQVNGNAAVVRVNGDLSTDHLDYQAASTVAVLGWLYLDVNPASNAVNAATFGNTDGVLQVSGNIQGVSGKAAVTTSVDGTGTVTMMGNSTITGGIGATGLAIKQLNIGSTGTGAVDSLDTTTDLVITTAINGDVFADTILLGDNDAHNNWSTLVLGSGFDITGAVKTETNETGTLTLSGGTQTVTGTVGLNGAALHTVESGADNAVSTFTGAVYATNVTNTGTGSSTFNAAVTATNVNIDTGTSTFQSTLVATTTNIGTDGKGVFNGTTTTAINFTGAGTADLNQGLTGTIAFGTNDGTVNLADGKAISGAITSTNMGTLNVLGAGTLNGAVGTLSALNVNTTGTTSQTLQANANVAATTIVLFNDGVLKVADGANVTGAVTTDTDSTGSTGSLTLDGTSTVTGNVGGAGLGLLAVNAGADSKTVTFGSSVVIADTLNYTGDGTVVFNGNGATGASYTSGAFSNASDLGFVGTVDFGTNVTNTGTFTLGDNVDLITAHDANATANTQTAFADANGATLSFAGSSVVTGDLGSAANTGNENFKDVYAGATGATVTFQNKVYVASTTFHVAGTGIVNFMDDLNGPLVFDANGSVNAGDGVNINGPVTTSVNGQGTLNFVGSGTTQADIGAASMRLAAVNFHAATSDGTVMPVSTSAEVVGIGHNIYALATTIGNGTNATEATITATGLNLGTAVTLTSTTTLNTAGSVTTTDAISPVNFAHTKNANGTLTNTAAVTQSLTGAGALTTAGATLNFAMGTTDWASDAGGTVNGATSSSITGATGSTLVTTGDETVNLSLLGSLRDGQAYTLVDVDGGNTIVPTTLRDNSFVIDTALSRNAGDLIVTATRGNDVYITKSATSGDISNAAALRLGTLAAAGSGYSEDFQTVLNKLDIDQWGFGNSQANLANQVKSLIPVANGSIANAGLDAQSHALDQIGSRLKDLREVEFTADGKKPKAVWIRNLLDNRRQDATAGYDAYKTKFTGFQIGGDISPSQRSLIGLAISNGSAEVSQYGLRAGELSNVGNTQLTVYGSYDFSDRFYADAMASTARLSISGLRGTVVGRQARFNHDAKGTAFKLNLGYKIPVINEATSLTPMLSLQRTSLTEDAYVETGAGDVGLSVAERKQSRQETGLGLRFATTTMFKGYVVKPEFAIMRTRDNKALDAQTMSASYIGDTSATAFDTDLATAAKPYASKVQLGMSMLLNKSSALSLRYEHTKGSGYKSNKGELAVRWNW